MTKIFSSLKLLIYTDRNNPSVYIEGIPDGIKRIKKTRCVMMCKFLWIILPMELQSDSNRVVISYYFLELNLMISFLIFRRHIIAG